MTESLPDILSRRVAATPSRTAIIDADTGTERSYEELDADVADRAGRLAGLGLAAGDRLGLLAETTIPAVESVHASFRLGVRLVPLNVRNTADEIEHQLATAGVDRLLCDPDHADLATAATRDLSIDPVSLRPTNNIVALDSVEPAPSGRVDWDPDDPMLVMFTSGTTGSAKAVPLTIHNLQWSAIASAFRLGTLPDDRWLCCLPLFHMGGLAPILRTALYGSTAVILEDTDPDAIVTATRRHDVTGVSLVPTILRRIFETEESLADCLRTVLLGGAATSEELIRDCEEREVPVHPTYGLTEAASQVTTATPTTVFEHPDTVGQPLLGTDVTIVDEADDEQPAGEIGEIAVDGPTVTPGYLGSVETSFGRHGLYTGDLGYRDATGRLYVTGRLDDMITTGGETVHAGTVESTLRKHPAVTDAAVVGLEDREWGERVAAAVVGDVEAPALRTFCEDRLAGYERPRSIRIVDSIPRTASGSIDRNAVRDLLTSY